MSWTFDAPSSTYKNHFLSSKIREEALADSVFMRFVRPEPGYGKRKGESITITRILQLPLAGRVSETERLPKGRPAIETKQVSVSEWGFATEITEFERNLTHFDITNKFQQMLRNQLTLTMDKMVADAFKLTPYKYTPTSVTTGVFDTDGTVSTQATANLTVAHLREIHDELAGTLKCPPFRNGMYVGILSTRAARGIMNDPEYREWLAPTTAQPFITGRLKDIEGFMLIRTNHVNALANAIGLNGICGEAVFFGDDAVVLVDVMSPELRAGLVEDLGRFRELGWVGEIAAALVWEKASMARVIHVSST